MSLQTILLDHTSVETAYLVNNYPYGFRLRCKIRYWLEFKPGKGARLVSQTSNPKLGLDALGRDIWNKPKASTYVRWGAAMYLDENGHVQWSGLSEYTDAAEARAWRETYGTGNHPEMVKLTDAWIIMKEGYERRKREAENAANHVQEAQ